MAALTLADGGIGTQMVFLLGRKLNNFALFECINDSDGQAKLTQIYESYLQCAAKHKCKIQLSAPTWRANMDHMIKMGYEVSDVAEYNKRGIEFMRPFRDRGVELTVCGDVGSRGDGYVPDNIMTVEEAKQYHSVNIGGLAAGGADIIQGLAINYYQEAAGTILAAKDVNLPVSISFVVETDGKLVHGMPLQEAIKKVDAVTNGYASHFGINCAHPTHFESALASMDPAILARIKQIKVNASKRSHAELDEVDELDCGDIEELANQVAELRQKYDNLTIIGGCCGTDSRHIDAMARCILQEQR